jgi:hypothetical protein
MSLTDDDKAWLKGELDGQREWMKGAQDDQRAWVSSQLKILDAKIEHVETSLLTEFHKWASPLEMRLHSHTATLRAVDLEQEAIAERVTKLENRSPDPQ